MAYVKQTWENLPKETTPISAERLNHLETQYDEAVADSKRYTNSTISTIPAAASFDFNKARISYGTTIGVSDRFVQQDVMFCEADNNRPYVSRWTPGTEPGRETTVVTRLGASGSGAETMTFIDAGHGDAVFFEYTPSASWVWTAFIDWRYPPSDPGNRHNYVRVPWSPGATYTYAEVERYKVKSISGRTWRANFDEFNGLVAFRDGSGATRSMYLHKFTDVRDKATLPAPISSCTITIRGGFGGVQSHAYLSESQNWFLNYGTSTGPQLLVAYNSSGSEIGSKDTRPAVETDAWGVPFSYCEPEGLKVHHSPDGAAHLLFAVATNDTYMRKMHVYSVGMGGISPALNMLGGTLPSDQSEWIPSSGTLATALNPDPELNVREVPSNPLRMSVSGGRVRFRGRLQASLPVAKSPMRLLTLHESFRPSVTTQCVCVVLGGGGVQRLEVSAAGNVSVFFDAATPSDKSFTEIDLSSVEFQKL